MALKDRFKTAFNVFRTKDQSWDRRGSPYDYGVGDFSDYGIGYAYRPDRSRFLGGKENVISSIINRISIDTASVEIRHVRQDNQYRFEELIKSSLYNCLAYDANIDQTGRAFRQDLVQTMLEEGCAAVVAVDTTAKMDLATGNEIKSLRVGTVVEWYPRHVDVDLYDDRKGLHQVLRLPKEHVAIVENPFYTIMNQPNSTLKRLVRKLHILDAIDEQSGSGRLDIIIQLPYVVKSEARREQANKRRKMIEEQLKGSKYGIAYTDGTEKITQLNRPSDNNMMKQIEYLQQLLYSELGLTDAIMNGTADEKAMLNYYSRVVEPILGEITSALNRTFLTKTARSQGQTLRAFNNPFRFVTMNELAEIADRFTRNEILSSNEVRGIMGFEPSDDPRADQLINKNMPDPNAGDTPHEVDEKIEVVHD